MLMALTSTDWLLSAGWRQGLFSHCIAPNAPTPLPFNVPNYGPECYPTREVGMFQILIVHMDFILIVFVNLGYIRVAAALCIVTLITDIVATLLTGLGLRSKDQRTKYKFYRVAVYVMLLACMYTKNIYNSTIRLIFLLILLYFVYSVVLVNSIDSVSSVFCC